MVNCVNNFFSLDTYCKNFFGRKVYKLALNLATTCPNRDGSKGVGGCIFCSEQGSGDYSSPFNQLQTAKEKLKDKQTNAYIAYFQSFTNTYMPIQQLADAVKSVLLDKEILGIAIATRADCLGDEILDFLVELSKITHLTVELGLNSTNDYTNIKINRCMTYKEFLNGYNLLVARGIKVCLHIINGLPGENEIDMINTAKCVNTLKPFSVKIHCLHILEGTKIAKMYRNNEINVLSQQDYIAIVCEQLAHLDSAIVIERLTGDGNRKDLLAPMWTLQKRKVLNGINKYLTLNGLYQGCKAEKI